MIYLLGLIAFLLFILCCQGSARGGMQNSHFEMIIALIGYTNKHLEELRCEGKELSNDPDVGKK